jgi:hypothetical protein
MSECVCVCVREREREERVHTSYVAQFAGWSAPAVLTGRDAAFHVLIGKEAESYAMCALGSTRFAPLNALRG